MKKRWVLIWGTVGLLGLSALASWIIGIRNLEVMQCRVVAGMEQALDNLVPGNLHRPVIEKLQGALAFGLSGQLNRCSALLMEHPACSSHMACNVEADGQPRPMIRVRVYRLQSAGPQIRVLVEQPPSTPWAWSWIRQS